MYLKSTILCYGENTGLCIVQPLTVIKQPMHSADLNTKQTLWSVYKYSPPALL